MVKDMSCGKSNDVKNESKIEKTSYGKCRKVVFLQFPIFLAGFTVKTMVSDSVFVDLYGPSLD